MTDAQTTRLALIATVGGSPQPVATALQELRPDVAWFVVSDGSDGTTSSRSQVEDREIFYDQAGTAVGPGLRHVDGCPQGNRVMVLPVPPDNPDKAFSACSNWIDELARQYPEHRIIADYTGGTKSMTGGLLMAALGKPGTEVQFMAGQRADLVAIAAGTEQPRQMSSDYVLARREFDRISTLMNGRDYGAAWELAYGLKMQSDRNRALSTSFRRRVNEATSLLNVLAKWDRFDHGGALMALEGLARSRDPVAATLERMGLVEPLRTLGSGNSLPSWERCADLWLNAQRTAARQKYDDAVARLYRLSEAAAQCQLWLAHKIPNPPPVTHVPNHILAKSTRITHREGSGSYEAAGLGLERSIEFLQYLDSRDQVAAAFANNAPGGRLAPDWLSMRNKSILAHGFRALTDEDWKTASHWVETHLRRFWKKVEPPQLPASLE
jgi:CRISPR-associated protein (TIGR02710 family)